MYYQFWYDVRIITVMRESVARNTENIKNSGFALTALYKLVPFQPPPIQLAARPLQSITMVSVFCWLYPPSLTNITVFCTIEANPSRCEVRQVRSSVQGEWWIRCGLEQVRWRSESRTNGFTYGLTVMGGMKTRYTRRGWTRWVVRFRSKHFVRTTHVS